MISSISELWAACENRLEDYLHSRDHKIVGKDKFTCLNPKHDDTHPSMHIIKSKTVNRYAKCFSCDTTYSIMDVWCIDEGLLNTPENFISNLQGLASYLEIPHNLKGASFQDVVNFRFFNFYQRLNSFWSETCLSQGVQSRGWTKETCEELGIFSKPDLKALYKFIETTFPHEFPNGFNRMEAQSFLREMGLLIGQDRFFFDNAEFVLTIQDENNRPCAYIARDADREAKKNKYLYTSNETVPIFAKADILYNYFNALMYIRKEQKNFLYVVEGQADAVTLYNAGLKNVVAIGGTSLSEKQIHLLKKANVSNIVFCLDWDKPGQAATYKILSSYMKYLTNIKVWVTVPDAEVTEKDPDDYIRKHGLTSFAGIKRVSGFDFLFAEFQVINPDADPNDILKFFVPVIATLPTAIDRETVARKLTLATGYSLSSILEDINAIVHEKENSINHSIKEIVEDIASKVRRDPAMASSLLLDAVTRVKVIESSGSSDYLTGSYFADTILKYREDSEAFTDLFPGFSLPLMPDFQNALNNDWSKGKMINIGGEENSGKTSMSCFFTYNLVMPEADNNIRALYMTIDDSVQELYTKFVCIAAREKTRGYRDYDEGFPLQINHVVRPQYWAKYLRDVNPQLEKDMWYAYNLGYQTVLDLARSERLIITGIPHCKSFKDFYYACERLRNKHADDNLWAFLDNIHKLPLPNSDARLAFKDISNDLKNMSVELDMAVGGTLEYNSDSNKRGKESRPTNASLAESRAFKYDANALFHMYNNMHVKGIDSPWYHKVGLPWDRGIQKRWPVVELIIGKNKISDDKTSHYFDFHCGSSYFEYVSPIDAIKRAVAIEEQMKGGGDGAVPVASLQRSNEIESEEDAWD